MTKIEVQIELITKKDIRSPSFGAKVFDVLNASSEKISPEYVNSNEPVNIPLEGVETWLRYWSSPGHMKFEGSRYDIDSGLIWRRRKASKSWGKVEHAHNLIHQGSSIFISSTWNKNIEWEKIFDFLVEIVEPEYAGLHVFGPQELSTTQDKKPFQVLAIWKLVADKYEGNWRRPDSFDLEAWKHYKHLPNLPFKAYLSSGFNSQYNLSKLGENVCVEHFGNGISIRLTDKLDEVINDFQSFMTKRKKVRSAFVDGFFTELDET